MSSHREVCSVPSLLRLTRPVVYAAAQCGPLAHFYWQGKCRYAASTRLGLKYWPLGELVRALSCCVASYAGTGQTLIFSADGRSAVDTHQQDATTAKKEEPAVSKSTASSGQLNTDQ